MAEIVDKLRNIALVGHSGGGKTSLAEVMLYNAGITNRLGSVDAGNTVMDFEPEELKRTSSISTGFHQFPWKKHDISIMDTPGDVNFFTDTKFCMQAADSIVLVVDGVDGLKVQSEQAWQFAADYNCPCMIFINRLDRERADFMKTYEDTRDNLSPKPILLQLPIGSEADFKGVVDLVSGKAYAYDETGKATEVATPADLQAQVDSEKEALIENIAEADDALLERYLEGETLSDGDIHAALKKGIQSRAFTPVLCGSATANIGIDRFCDFLVDAMPSPADRGSFNATMGDDAIEIAPDPDAAFSGFVFKTIADPYAGRLSIIRIVSGTLGGDGNFYNVTKSAKERFSQLLRIAGKEQKSVEKAGPGAIVAMAKLKETTTGDSICSDSRKVIFKFAKPLPTVISFALTAKATGEEDKIVQALSKLMEEDPALHLERRAETSEILLSGLGQIHIETAIDKMKRKYNVEALLNTPKIPYRETVKKKVRVQGRHKKQSGGHGQFGDCWIQLEPLPKGSGFEFVDAIVGGSIPRQYIPAVEKGVVESAVKGVLAGFPTVDFKVTLDDGSFHAVDSSEMAFKVAGSLAFKKAVQEAAPTLLEPIMSVTVTTPDEFMGDIMGDLNSRRGRVLGMDSAGKYQVIKAEVPLSEFQSYSPDLTSMTGGRGMYTMAFSRYEEVPAHLAEKVIAAVKTEQE